MGVKGFIGLVLLVIGILFIIQNLQAVPLVFFGTKPITLPLSIWIVSFVIAGLFFSIIIQILTNFTSSSSSTKSNNKRIPDSNQPNPSQDLPIQPPLTQKYPKNQEFDPFTPTYQEPFDDDNNSKSSEIYQDQDTYSSPKKDIIYKEEISQTLPEKERFEEEINDEDEVVENNNHDDYNKNRDVKTKPRSPLPYSYKPREKTRIRRKPQPPPEIQRPRRNEIYDANYRLIEPSSTPNNDRDNRDEDEEQWDF